MPGADRSPAASLSQYETSTRASDVLVSGDRSGRDGNGGQARRLTATVAGARRAALTRRARRARAPAPALAGDGFPLNAAARRTGRGHADDPELDPFARARAVRGAAAGVAVTRAGVGRYLRGSDRRRRRAHRGVADADVARAARAVAGRARRAGRAAGTGTRAGAAAAATRHASARAAGAARARARRNRFRPARTPDNRRCTSLLLRRRRSPGSSSRTGPRGSPRSLDRRPAGHRRSRRRRRRAGGSNRRRRRSARPGKGQSPATRPASPPRHSARRPRTGRGRSAWRTDRVSRRRRRDRRRPAGSRTSRGATHSRRPPCTRTGWRSRRTHRSRTSRARRGCWPARSSRRQSAPQGFRLASSWAGRQGKIEATVTAHARGGHRTPPAQKSDSHGTSSSESAADSERGAAAVEQRGRDHQAARTMEEPRYGHARRRSDDRTDRHVARVVPICGDAQIRRGHRQRHPRAPDPRRQPVAAHRRDGPARRRQRERERRVARIERHVVVGGMRGERLSASGSACTNGRSRPTMNFTTWFIAIAIAVASEISSASTHAVPAGA